jgi:RNA polymerase sigma-70 factor (ECF subfamily)
VSSISIPADRSPSRRKSSAPDGAAAERQLARWIAEGDEAALAELFDLVGPTLYAVALGISEDTRHAEGAVEETFAELWDKRASLGRLPALSPWLMERCRTWAVSLKAGLPVPHARALQERAADVPLTRRLLRCPGSLRAARVNGVLDGLAPLERQMVLLATRAGLGAGDIARQQGIKTDEVHALLRTGLRTLREGLEHTLRREIL